MIELKQVDIHAGDFSLRGLNLSVAPGSYAVLMGQTGQGKTTILESICGLRRVAAGSVWIDGMDVTLWPPARRQIGYVPQDVALFSSMTVGEHLAFALRQRKYSRRAIADRVDSVAQSLGIDSLLDRRPRHLSGGEAQRVALGRAVSFHPAVLLLDEPLSALDEATRTSMQNFLRSLCRDQGTAILHVTHDSQEAASLADHHWDLADGKISQRRPVEPQTPSTNKHH
ncbi:sn-glycerol-3-phosphate import ATP-binding protein UgpC [Rubripirellula lacrimiformis]|uniref:sn-glycerol-3-phosphate import ATP-binding protein UgpC n=1 Tax=Rubripirellula lacrimiformis TaxID=1930273 RepID=A0A517NJ02_9BACT|nr:ATP-binding cassette domain-containing protein [Rubripirellula lacrimiformis]QDT07120.1 sn-glycerol-3-phosphate import ATP-binding protein UgpC [Rubripirellula lacrimiformis]